MPYPQSNYQRLVYGEYPVAMYRSACHDAVRKALVREEWWENINADIFTTVGSSHLQEDRYVVVRVKSRAIYANARLDKSALERAFMDAAGSDIDISRWDFPTATLKRCDRRAETNCHNSLYNPPLRNNNETQGTYRAPQSVSDMMDGRENPLARYFVYTQPSYGGVHSTGDYSLDPRARRKARSHPPFSVSVPLPPLLSQNTMPYLRVEEAPTGIPKEETVVHLLGERHTEVKHRRKIKTYNEITEAQRTETGLVQWGKRRDVIPGDPYGLWRSWAGNLSHHRDYRMLSILPPIFDKVKSIQVARSEMLETIRDLLSKVRTTDLVDLVSEFCDHDPIDVSGFDGQQYVVDIPMGSKTIRIMHCWDISLDAKWGFAMAQRHQEAERRIDHVFKEPPMTTEVQQYLMARIILEDGGNLRSINNQQGQIDVSHKDFTKDLQELRSEAQESFWLVSTEAERETLRKAAAAASGQDKQVDHIAAVLKANWPRHWNNGRYDPDLFYHYLRDKIAAEKVWDLVDADVFVVLDAERRVIFANVEGAAQLLFGDEIIRELNRAIDMYSFFVPIRAPEARRHVVDRHIRRTHPILDPSIANLYQLQSAKMGIAHYGCWTPAESLVGKYVFQSSDCQFPGTRINHLPRTVFPWFCKSVLAKASEVIRFLMQSLDPEYYEQCQNIYRQLPKEEAIKTTEDDFLSMFVLGINAHTQRHRDPSDIRGGYAGLFTVGEYQGEQQSMIQRGNLCIPQLAFKVPYRPGACALVRSDRMEHLVADYTGLRYSVAGTNHESVKKYAMRKMASGGLDPAQLPEDDEEDVNMTEKNKPALIPSLVEEPPSDVDDPLTFPLEMRCVDYDAGSDGSDYLD
ncbi:hypothetical protein PG996_004683 [Apiospora saccharicola]|uniref:Uncharacterized protein n=1 Tax=Apiospora saccharicola TaxID=335842 RepID=A0ABR1W8M3_9PEZI